MIRIFHSSDFHLNKENLSDWKIYIKKDLIRLINEHQQDGVQPIIVCTGDLIDKGSDSDWGIEETFNKFKEEVILPIIKATKLSIDRFVIIPGNHDIDRKKDKSFQANGLRGEFKKEQAKEINRFTQNVLDNKEYDGVKRMQAYKQFEAELYKDCPNVHPSYFSTYFTYKINSVKVGIAGYNSSWNAYDNNDKNEGLAIGEAPYNYCKAALEDCDVKIALMHHPLDWFPFEKHTIGTWIYQDYDILCVGHVHEGDTCLQTNAYGTMFMDVAPSFTNEIHNTEQGAFANGLTYIEFDEKTKDITCYYLSFNLKSRKYILKTDFVENGYHSFNLANKISDSMQDIIDNSLEYIKNTQYTAINNTLIPQKANVMQGLIEAFVMPPVYMHGDDQHIDVSLQEIMQNNANVVLLGLHESGKTVMLYRMLMEYSENYYQYGLIPVYIDFLHIGNKDIETLVREYLGISSEHAKQLLADKKVVLLVDNYDPIEEYKFSVQKVYKFHHDYESRIIATCNTEMSGLIPNRFTTGINQLGFEYYHIRQFRAAQVRELMDKWSPEKEFGKRMAKMDKLVSNFISYSLPCTPMTVSLYLWSRDEKRREPINKAVLLDIYISIILERLDPNNIFQNTFDYKNKTLLLSHLASKFNECEGYKMRHADYIKTIDSYMRTVGFERFPADKVGEFFINHKLFVRYGDEVSFAHSCFFYYFLALRMVSDSDFKSEVLHPNNFFKYEQVIDYYGGLVRSDKELLSFIYSEFETMFQPVKEVESLVNYDDFFTNIVQGAPAYKPIATQLDVNRIYNNKPSEKEVEKRRENVYDKKLESISDSLNKDVHKTPALLIVMMCEALRNLDGVEDWQLKYDVYSSIVKNSLLYSAITRNNLAIYANQHNGKLPTGLEIFTNVERFLRFMPLAIQTSLGEILATTKLNSFFRKKLESDYKGKTTDIEKFFSIGMLWDSSSLENEEDMKRFISKAKKNCSIDYALTKLLYYYITRVKSGSEEEEVYLKLFAAIKARGYLIPSLKRRQIIKGISKKN